MKLRHIKWIIPILIVIIHFPTPAFADIHSFSPSNWMEHYSEHDPSFKNTPINKIAMPGSHDAGMNPDIIPTPSPDDWDVRNNTTFRLTKRALPFICHWTITQSHSVGEQLHLGSRYLDLRVAPMISNSSSRGYHVEETNLYTLHGVYGESMDSIFSSCKNFLEKHPKEILIFHFQHFYEMTEVSYSYLKTCIQHYLGKWLIPQSYPLTVPIGKLQEDNKRVYILLGIDHQRYTDPLKPLDYFPETVYYDCSNALRSQWPDTRRLKKLHTFCDKEVRTHQNFTKLWVLQAVLTPNVKMIVKRVIKSVLCNQLDSLYALEAQLDHTCLSKWVREWTKEDLSLNVVMADFLEDPLTRQIIHSNLHQKG